MQSIDNQEYTQLLHDYRVLVDQKIQSSYRDSEPAVLYDPIKYILEAGGKRLRPIITMLAAGSIGGIPEQAAGCGAALEILHNFTLVHDDIMDRSPLRRGRPTVHTKWNEAAAILSGDVMMGVAYRLLIQEVLHNSRQSDILINFTQGLIDVCEGQAHDLNFQDQEDVSMKEYLRMIEMKTARLIQLSAVIGGLYANAQVHQVEALTRYAYHVGIAFQIQDDVLDLTAPEAEFGKRTGQDLLEGKKSYLIVRAHEKITDGTDADVISTYIKKKGISSSEIPSMVQLFEKHGILDDAMTAIDLHAEQAIAVLEVLPHNVSTDCLGWLAGIMAKRKQ